jgi:hypothetical protein
MVGDFLRDELIHEEAIYKCFMRNVAKVVEVLESGGLLTPCISLGGLLNASL